MTLSFAISGPRGVTLEFFSFASRAATPCCDDGAVGSPLKNLSNEVLGLIDAGTSVKMVAAPSSLLGSATETLLTSSASSALKTSRAAIVPERAPSHSSSFGSFSRTKRVKSGCPGLLSICTMIRQVH